MRLALLTLLLLGGCSWFRGTPIPPEENTPDHQACRAEATNTPAQARLAEQINPNNQYNMQRVEQERRVIYLRAYRDCLRRKGLALPGGVEPVRPR